LAGLVTLAGLLEALPRSGVLPAEYLPPTSTILAALVEQFGRAEFWLALGLTLRTWLTGLAISLSAGLILGIVIGSVPALRAATASTIEFLRPIPSVALIPLAVVLYGSGMRATLLLVIYASFWQILLQVLHGVTDVDPLARETANSYRISRLRQARHLVWPTTLPYAMTGVRLSAAVALILTLTGELVIGTPGLGNEIANASGSIAIPAQYALVVVAGLTGVMANVVTRTAERKVLAWHPSVRKEVAV
jgi:ABC-type nitrate/sulfonate/bicarbonate transport system permease component